MPRSTSRVRSRVVAHWLARKSPAWKLLGEKPGVVAVEVSM
jgi:hypothetical protein